MLSFVIVSSLLHHTSFSLSRQEVLISLRSNDRLCRTIRAFGVPANLQFVGRAEALSASNSPSEFCALQLPNASAKVVYDFFLINNSCCFRCSVRSYIVPFFSIPSQFLFWVANAPAHSSNPNQKHPRIDFN